jgi:hypothetical protein
MKKIILTLAILLNIVVVLGTILTTWMYAAQSDLLAWFTYSIPLGMSLSTKLLWILIIIPIINIIALLMKKRRLE